MSDDTMSVWCDGCGVEAPLDPVEVDGRVLMVCEPCYREHAIEQVTVAAERVWKPEGVAVFLDAPNRMLGGATPRALVEAGEVGKVLALLAALDDGVVM